MGVVRDSRGKKLADTQKYEEFKAFVQEKLQAAGSVALPIVVQRFKELFPQKGYKARESQLRRFRSQNSIVSEKIEGKYVWKTKIETSE